VGDKGELHCPNCGATAVPKSDGSAACPQCNGTFTWTAGEAKLTGVGEFEDLQGRVTALEKENAELRKLLPAGPEKQGAPQEEESGPETKGAPLEDESEDDDGDEFD